MKRGKMIDKQILEWCGFKKSVSNMFFSLDVEVWYHPSGIWIPFSDNPDSDLLNEEEFCEEDIILDGIATSVEDFLFIFLNKFGERAYMVGAEDADYIFNDNEERELDE